MCEGSVIKRKWFAAGVPIALVVGFVFLVGALTVPAFAQLTIDAARTTPVATSEAPAGEDLIVDPAGSITIDEEGPIITIDSDTNVTIQTGATLTNTAVSNALGIDIDLQQDRTSDLSFGGTITLGEVDTTMPLGSNNTGIRIGLGGGLGKLMGDVTFESNAVLRIEGIDSVGVAISQEIVGDVTFGGGTTVSGANSVGVISTAAITGQMTFRGNVVARGTSAASFEERDPVSGTAVVIGASIVDGLVGGVRIDGPIDDFDGRFPAQIRSFGGAPAVYISPSVAGAPDASIELGLYSDFDAVEDNEVLELDPNFNASTGLGNFSFVNRGSIQSDGLEPGVNTEAFRIEGQDNPDMEPDFNVIFNGGLYNNGGIVALASSHNLQASNEAEAAADGTALIVGNLAVIPELVNDGTITGSTTGPAGGTAIGVLIEPGGVLPSITNNSAINGLVTTTEGADLDNVAAYAIRDLSGTLRTIDNTGVIAATATSTTGGSTAFAIDVSSSTEAVTVANTQLESRLTPANITGDILFGSALDNVLTIDGHVTNDDGVTSRALVDGQVSAIGSVDIFVTDGTLRTDDTVVNNLIVGSASAPSDEAGTVEFLLDDEPSLDPIITASGMIDFHTNSTASFTSVSFLGSEGTYTLLTATGGIDLNGRSLDELVAFDEPFLFDSAFDIVTDGGTDALTLALERKTAADLNLTGNSAAVFDAALMAAGEDDFFGRGLLAITDAVGVDESLNSLVPNIGAGARALSIAVTDSVGGPVGRRQRSLIATPEQGLRFWGQQFFQDLNGSTTDNSPSYFGSGTGVSVGMEWGQSATARYGISYTYFAGQVTESDPRATKENIALNLVSAYASWRTNNFFVTPQANVGYASYANRRRVVAGPITRRAISDWNNFLTSGGVTSGYVMNLGAFEIIPHVSIDGLYMYDTGYTERLGGDGVNLSLGSRTTRSVRVFAGVIAQTEFNLDDGVMKPQILAGWSHDFINDRPIIDASFEAAPGSQFSVVGPVSDASRLMGGASFAYLFENWSAAFNYDAAHTSGALSQSASITMTSRF